MYNLFVTADSELWNNLSCEFDFSRTLKSYTKDFIQEKFKPLDESAIAILKQKPCIFTIEQNLGDNLARVGWIKRVRSKDSRVKIDFELMENVDPIPLEKLQKLHWDFDVGDWELGHTHWAVKDIDLFSAMIECGLVLKEQLPKNLLSPEALSVEIAKTSEIKFLPTVFRIPKGSIEENLVSVMMPFEKSFDPVYESIGETCKSAGLICKRADVIWEEEEVIQDVFSLIYRSSIVICDLTGKNPNVFYEAGIAHTLGKPVILISQHEKDVPFDLQHFRYQKYLNNNEGRSELKSQLESRLNYLRKN